MRAIGPHEIIVAFGVVAAAAACTLDFDRFRAETAADTTDVIDAPDATGVSSGDPRSDAGGPGPSPIDAVDGSTDAGADAPIASSCDEPGLVARFRFDEGAGGTVNDCSTSKHVGSVVGAPVWTSGHAGGALALDGSFVSLGSAPKLDVKGAFTAAAWIRVTSFPKKPSAYVFGKTASIYQGGWRLGLEPGAISFAVSRGPAKAELQAEAPLSATGTWVHVAGVFQPGSGVTIYVGGVQAGSNTTDPPAAVSPIASDLRVGVRGDGDASTYYRGAVDDVRLYARALSAAEIAAIAAE